MTPIPALLLLILQTAADSAEDSFELWIDREAGPCRQVVRDPWAGGGGWSIPISQCAALGRLLGISQSRVMLTLPISA